MKIIFSRKGFDSTAGGFPSPIIAGRPVSLPIPATDRSETTYAALGHGGTVEQTTRGKIGANTLCHDDPLFADGYCWFGQHGAAQGHLAKNDVTAGDVFLFFGLFAEPATGERHHRIFGFMEIAAHGHPVAIGKAPQWRDPPRAHPHFIGQWPASNSIYFGAGRTANSAPPSLRLTQPGGPLNLWTVPNWLRPFGLTYHTRPQRWIGRTQLDSAKRGQEFICDVGKAEKPRAWLGRIIAEIDRQ